MAGVSLQNQKPGVRNAGAASKIGIDLQAQAAKINHLESRVEQRARLFRMTRDLSNSSQRESTTTKARSEQCSCSKENGYGASQSFADQLQSKGVDVTRDSSTMRIPESNTHTHARMGHNGMDLGCGTAGHTPSYFGTNRPNALHEARTM